MNHNSETIFTFSYYQCGYLIESEGELFSVYAHTGESFKYKADLETEKGSSRDFRKGIFSVFQVPTSALWQWQVLQGYKY